MYKILPQNIYGKALWALWKDGVKIAEDDDPWVLAHLAGLQVREAGA